MQEIAINVIDLVMGSIEENRYQYSIDTLAQVSRVSILRYPSKNPHHKLCIQISHRFRLSDFEFFKFLQYLPRFPVISILDFNFFFLALFGHYSSDKTIYRYLNKLSILNDIKSYRYSIDNIDIISHH